tara:strand:- start:2765 stop:3088 length:324 start_codon:yes stop_codon:yes gene_type:complete
MSANVSPNCCPCSTELGQIFGCDKWNKDMLKRWFDYLAVEHKCAPKAEENLHMFSKAFWLLRAQNQSAANFGPPTSTNLTYSFPWDACPYSCELIERIEEELSEGCV